MKIAVIGAGLAGLAAAMRLRKQHDVVVLERDAQAGGKIRSQQLDGLLFEWGPNGFLSSASGILELVSELGIESELVEANAAASKRYIYWNGRLHALPVKPQQALGMSLLSLSGKLRALRELRRKPGSGPADESVAAFFERHFGAQVAQRIVAPALLGITGGDAAQTSVEALFPRLRVMEREHGSVLRAMMRGGAARTRLMSFGAAGFQRFAAAMAQSLGERLRFDAAVDELVPQDNGWIVRFGSESLRADAVVVAAPSYAAADLLGGVDAELAAALRRIAYAPMRVAGVAFRAQDVPVPLDGFGFLAARGAGLRILGALYTSTMFASQAPPGTAYLRIFLGGATDPQAVDLEANQARAIVLADLRAALRITAEPLAYHDVVWKRAIPQYALQHRATLEAIGARVAAHPGLHLTGNAYRGIGVGDTVRDALAVAAAI